MGDDPESIVESLTSLKIPKNHATVGLSNMIAGKKSFAALFKHKRLPDVGWSDIRIQQLLLTLSTLDTNHEFIVDSTTPLIDDDDDSADNDDGKSLRWCGVGEREGRVYSTLVSSRHWGLSHGIGRSGDITEAQPKAAGSSAMARLTLQLALDAARRGAGLDARTAAAHGILLPLCTGMAMSLVLAALRDMTSHDHHHHDDENDNETKKIVLWSRIDQKSCFKAISSSGFRCVVIPTKINPDTDEVMTDLDELTKAIEQYRKGTILAVITTTSCFAPRIPDSVDEVAKICAKNHIPHVINHAYGLQCQNTCKLINRACVLGRVDAIVCSTDKNFLVPVGGAMVMSPNAAMIQTIGKVYPGRASGSPLLDLFITLLSMGLHGYKQILENRKLLLASFQQQFHDIAMKYNERLLICPRNTISFGMTIDTLDDSYSSTETTMDDQDLSQNNKTLSKKNTTNNNNTEEISYFGSMLFTRCVSGTRVIPKNITKKMGNQTFLGFGSSTEYFPHSYLTAACAIGLSKNEMNVFFTRLDRTLKDYFMRKQKKKNKNNK